MLVCLVCHVHIPPLGCNLTSSCLSGCHRQRFWFKSGQRSPDPLSLCPPRMHVCFFIISGV